jgi:ATP-dependent helicase/nuclease subunit B
MHIRFQVPPDDEGGVQVLGMEESAGHAWKEIYLGGLVDGKFPQRLPQNIFLPEATLETLGVRTLEHARLAASFHFYRLLQSAPKVVLTRPENVGDKPVVPSPFLEELAPLRKAGMLKEQTGIQFSFEIRDCRSVPELAKALALAGGPKGAEDLLAMDLPGMDGIRGAMAYHPPASAALPAPEAARVFRVTELEDYLRCPYDYYVKDVLGIEPLEEPTEDISPRDRGSKVHSILRKFYLSWEGPVTADARPDALALLRRLADEVFRKDADTFRNRREKELFLHVMAERFLDAETLYWQQGLRPAYLEQKIEGFALALPDGTLAELHAKIDRIDVDQDGNFVIVDYKTGKYPQPKNGVDQEIFQLPVYAVMARSMTGPGPTLKRPVGLAYYDLAGKFGNITRDTVLYDREAMGEQPAAKPQSSRKSADEFEQVLSASMDKAKLAIGGILRGEFPLKPRDENHCRYCPNEVMCRNEETELDHG